MINKNQNDFISLRSNLLLIWRLLSNVDEKKETFVVASYFCFFDLTMYLNGAIIKLRYVSIHNGKEAAAIANCPTV